MGGGGRRDTPCPWCRRPVPLPGVYRPRRGKELPLLRCECGAVGLASLHPEADWPRVAEGVLGRTREAWPDPGWGLEQIEQRREDDWDRIQRGEELPPDVDVLWYPLLWGRRKERGEGKV